MDFLHLHFVDILDIFLLTLLFYYIYKLVKGTTAVHIFLGIVFFYLFWQLTRILKMEMLSGVLGEFVKVGVVAMVVVFQQEIRKFLLMLGSTKLTGKNGLISSLRAASKNDKDEIATDVVSIIKACQNMEKTNTGALIVIKRTNSLEGYKSSGDQMHIEVNTPIIESIFFNNSTLHDGAMVVEENIITSTRVILPVTENRGIPLRYGLRHRAAIGVSEKTDAVVLVVSEETGKTSYIKDGEFKRYENHNDLIEKLKEDLR